MKRNSYLALICLGIISVLAISIGRMQSSIKPKILIGAILPMSGNLAFLGVGNRNALAMFQKHNPDVKFIFFDSKGMPSPALSAARDIADQDILYSITSLSYIVNTVQPIFNDARIANFSLSMDTAAEKKSSYNLRLYSTFEQEMDKLNDIARKKNFKRILVFYNDVDTMKNAVERYFRRILPPNAILITVPYSSSTIDFRNIILSQSQSNPDVIRILDFGDKLLQILNQISESKSFEGVPIVSGVETMVTDYKKIPESIKTRFRFTTPKFLLDPQNPVVKEYKREYGTMPSFDALYSYDIAKILIPEIRKLGYRNVDTVIESISSMNQFSGSAAHYKINKDGGITPNIFWAKIYTDKIVFIGDARW